MSQAQARGIAIAVEEAVMRDPRYEQIMAERPQWRNSTTIADHPSSPLSLIGMPAHRISARTLEQTARLSVEIAATEPGFGEFVQRCIDEGGKDLQGYLRKFEDLDPQSRGFVTVLRNRFLLEQLAEVRRDAIRPFVGRIIRLIEDDSRYPASPPDTEPERLGMADTYLEHERARPQVLERG